MWQYWLLVYIFKIWNNITNVFAILFIGHSKAEFCKVSTKAQSVVCWIIATADIFGLDPVDQFLFLNSGLTVYATFILHTCRLIVVQILLACGRDKMWRPGSRSKAILGQKSFEEPIQSVLPLDTRSRSGQFIHDSLQALICARLICNHCCGDQGGDHSWNVTDNKADIPYRSDGCALTKLWSIYGRLYINGVAKISGILDKTGRSLDGLLGQRPTML